MNLEWLGHTTFIAMSITPRSKPQLTPDKVRVALSNALARLSKGVKLELMWKECPTVLFAVRGYYRDTMGVPGVNDAGVYDDAVFIVSADSVIPFNWNTDPSVIGWNASLGKPYAMLKEGIWPFVKGMHKGRIKAWRQPDDDQAKSLKLERIFLSDGRKLGQFVVIRDPGTTAKGKRYEDEGYHAINLHDGSDKGTSSWGCGTAPPKQYGDFQVTSYKLTEGQTWLPYILTEDRVA